MDIAGMSAVMQQSKTMQQVDIALAKKIMDQTETDGKNLTKMLEQSSVQAPHPTAGKSIDIKG